MTVPVPAPGAIVAEFDDNVPAPPAALSVSDTINETFPARGCMRPPEVGVLLPSVVRTSVQTVSVLAPAETLALNEPNAELGPEIRIADGARVTVSVPDAYPVAVAPYVTVAGEAPSPVDNPVPSP